MGENRVREIFYKHWANKSLNEALIAARKEIAEEILSDIFSSQVMDKERQELIFRINDARGRIGYFTPPIRWLKSTPRSRNISSTSYSYIKPGKNQQSTYMITTTQYRQENLKRKINAPILKTSLNK